jgi:hypothetical protein
MRRGLAAIALLAAAMAIVMPRSALSQEVAESSAIVAAALSTVMDSLPSVYRGSLPKPDRYLVDPDLFAEIAARTPMDERVSLDVLTTALSRVATEGPLWLIERRAKAMTCETGSASICTMDPRAVHVSIGGIRRFDDGRIGITIGTTVAPPESRRLSSIGHVLTFGRNGTEYVLVGYEVEG